MTSAGFPPANSAKCVWRDTLCRRLNPLSLRRWTSDFSPVKEDFLDSCSENLFSVKLTHMLSVTLQTWITSMTSRFHHRPRPVHLTAHRWTGAVQWEFLQRQVNICFNLGFDMVNNQQNITWNKYEIIKIYMYTLFATYTMCKKSYNCKNPSDTTFLLCRL